jgi:hypothetical protein
VVHWILLWRQFNQIVLIYVRSVVSLTLLSWIINAIEYNLLGLRSVVQQFFLLLPCKLIAHGGIELMNGFKILASLLEPRPIPEERLLNPCARQFYRLLPHLVVYVLFVVNQTFEIARIIIFIVGQPIILGNIIWQIAVVLRKLRGLLLQAGLEC